MSRGRESNNTVGKSETAVQAQKADDVKTIPEEHSETEQERKKALEDMKWKERDGGTGSGDSGIGQSM